MQDQTPNYASLPNLKNCLSANFPECHSIQNDSLMNAFHVGSAALATVDQEQLPLLTYMHFEVAMVSSNDGRLVAIFDSPWLDDEEDQDELTMRKHRTQLCNRLGVAYFEYGYDDYSHEQMLACTILTQRHNDSCERFLLDEPGYYRSDLLNYLTKQEPQLQQHLDRFMQLTETCVKTGDGDIVNAEEYVRVNAKTHISGQISKLTKYSQYRPVQVDFRASAATDDDES